AAHGDEQVGGIADRGVGGDAGEPIRPTAFQPDTELAERGRLASLLIGEDQTGKGLFYGLRKESRFGADLLLFKDVEWFGKLRAALFYLFFQHRDLGILTAEAEDGRAR